MLESGTGSTGLVHLLGAVQLESGSITCQPLRGAAGDAACRPGAAALAHIAPAIAGEIAPRGSGLLADAVAAAQLRPQRHRGGGVPSDTGRGLGRARQPLAERGGGPTKVRR